MKRLAWVVLFLFAAVLSAIGQGYTGKPFSALSTVSNNSTLIYNDRALGKKLTVINTTATQFFLKLYDKKTAPTCGTDTPIWRTPISANNTNNGGVLDSSLEDLEFFNGIGFCLTGGIADSDNSNANTGVAINLSFYPR